MRVQPTHPSAAELGPPPSHAGYGAMAEPGGYGPTAAEPGSYGSVAESEGSAAHGGYASLQPMQPTTVAPAAMPPPAMVPTMPPPPPPALGARPPPSLGERSETPPLETTPNAVHGSEVTPPSAHGAPTEILIDLTEQQVPHTPWLLDPTVAPDSISDGDHGVQIVERPPTSPSPAPHRPPYQPPNFKIEIREKWENNITGIITTNY